MRAVTDSGPTQPNSEMSEPVRNLFTLLEVVSKPEIVEDFKARYNDCTIRYGDMKKQLAEDIINFTNPFRERIEEIKSDEKYLARVVKMGKEKAHESASKTIKEVREIIGIKPFF
jgi:tryptophanyl-tRNA synthetase